MKKVSGGGASAALARPGFAPPFRQPPGSRSMSPSLALPLPPPCLPNPPFPTPRPLPPRAQRMQDWCQAKGFDAVDPDNMDGYTNDSGFPLEAKDQLAYNRMIASVAHGLGLGAGLKNDLDQLNELTPDFDFFVNE
jgi:hypothetical protein